MNKLDSLGGNAHFPLFSPFDEMGSGGGNGYNRRQFLKRSGAATAATFIAWHATSVSSYAGSNNEAPVEVLVRIPTGSTRTWRENNNPPESPFGMEYGNVTVETTDTDTLNSGEKFTKWVCIMYVEGDGHIEYDWVNGVHVVTGSPTTMLAFRRYKTKK